MFLIDTEDDCFSEAIVLAHEICEMARDCFGTSTQRNDSLKIFRLIFVVRDFTTVSIKVAFARSPSSSVPLRNDTMNAIGREKSVFDALSKAVLIDRVAKVSVRVAVIFA